MNKNVLWLTRSAVLTALLVVSQMVTAPLGNTLVTGSIVNMILVVSVMTCGIPTGVTVAVISPICAKLVNIGPLWSLIPFIIAGNITLVVLWELVGHRYDKKYSRVIALVTAAVGKFAVLYIGIVKLAVPVLLQMPEPKASVISATFSVPQLFTASIGGMLALAILPAVEKAIKPRLQQI